MADILSWIVPPGLDLFQSLLLIVVSFFTSAITATFGLGGGSAMIAVMSLLMSPAVVVPVHGAVQLGSNAGRAVLRRNYIQWDFAGWFVLGSAIGAVIGGQVAQFLPEHWFRAAIALFILYSIWAPKPVFKANGTPSYVAAGTFTSAVGMVVGVSGPLVISFLKHLTDRREIVGTHAFLMSMQNTFKLVTFMLLGFAFHDYVILILLMIATGYAGTHLGSHFLDRLPETVFRWAFRIILTVIAIDLLRRSFFGG
ncbi:MAG: sulfite exporter TauE/SafE family protein [Hyphomicrobiaceae bacterium]|nr:sulfite exporter TauE/SafE family protein [Hyphomicrobiaceae bacterium]MCC0025289.1 sulfite exporter TauE/SafE family protein [Hyphomicrobiaceae bacterium]